MLLWIILIIGIVFLDQLSKWLTVAKLDLYETFPVIKDVFHFTYVRNEGAAFGILKDHRWVFLVVSTVAIIALSVLLWKKKNESKLMCVSVCFIVGGGIGNMIDRLSLGYVVDFLDFRIINYPIFNIADSFVCVGVALFALYVILDEVKEHREKKAALSTDEAEAKKEEENTELTDGNEENSESDN